MNISPDLDWTDDEIVSARLTRDTDFLFARMTEMTINAVDPRPGELILDLACGRAIDAAAMAGKGASLIGAEPSPAMVEKALPFLGSSPATVRLVRAIAEELPFPDAIFHKTVCKGAMDHFADLEKSMAEMARVTRPGGRIVIAIANFASLTCRIGKAGGRLRELLGRELPERPFWEPPEDHNYKFDLKTLENLMTPFCRMEKITGVSLLWGLPGWGGILERLPKGTAEGVLKLLDRTARLFPELADVLIAKGVRRS